MEKADKVKLLKLNLQITTGKLDGYLGFLLDSAAAMIRREGVHLVESFEDVQLTLMYAAYLYRKRNDDPGPMPRSLRFALNNRIFSEAAGAVISPDDPGSVDLPESGGPSAGDTLEILLISVELGENPATGEQVPQDETSRAVIAELSSVTSLEVSRAGTDSLTPEFVAKVPAQDYAGERYADIGVQRYAVYRTYAVPGTDQIELYLGRRAGVRREQNRAFQ